MQQARVNGEKTNGPGVVHEEKAAMIKFWNQMF